MFNDLYMINCNLICGEEYIALAAKSLEISVPIKTWHMRFAHFEVDQIKALSKGDLVEGLHIKHDQQAPGKCKPCILGNQKQQPFDADVEHETEVLGRVMLDIWEPARVQSIGGSRYAMIFINDASSHHSPYYLSDQRAETTVETLELFANIAERQMGKKLKKICCDNEFDCLLWRTWAAKSRNCL